MKHVFSELPNYASLGGYVLEAIIELGQPSDIQTIHKKVNELMISDTKDKKPELINRLDGIGSTMYIKNNIQKQLKLLEELKLIKLQHGKEWQITAHMRKIMLKDYANDFFNEINGSAEIQKILSRI